VVEGKTPEITVQGARTLLIPIDTSHVLGWRDRAIIAVLIYTISRAGAVAKLRRGSFYHAGEQQSCIVVARFLLCSPAPLKQRGQELAEK
jgi:hypothetical protein